MKSVIAAGAALLLSCVAAPSAAFVAEVTTSVPVDDSQDQGHVTTALQTAVDGVLQDAIAFTPTVIVLTHAVIRGNRLYVRLLLADQAGEQTVQELAPAAPAPSSDGTELQI